MHICPRCGAENRGNKAACWNCWSPLDAPGEGALAQERVKAGGPSLRVPWKLLLVVILIAAVGGGAYFFKFYSRPDDVATAYLDAVLNGMTERRDQLTSSTSSGQNLLPGALRLYRAEGNPPATVAGDTATMSATVELTIDGDQVTAENAASAVRILQVLQRQLPMEVCLVKEGSKWKVDQDGTRASLLANAARLAPAELQPLVRTGTIPKVIAPPPPPPGMPAPASATRAPAAPATPTP